MIALLVLLDAVVFMVMLLRLLLLLLLLHLRYVVHLGIKLAGHLPLLVFATEDHYASLGSHLLKRWWFVTDKNLQLCVVI